MSNLKISLLSIPHEVIEHVIFAHLSLSSLIVCSMVSKKFNFYTRRYFPQIQERLAHEYESRNRNSNENPPHKKLKVYTVLKELFQFGLLELYKWFMKMLRYRALSLVFSFANMIETYEGSKSSQENFHLISLALQGEILLPQRSAMRRSNGTFADTQAIA